MAPLGLAHCPSLGPARLSPGSALQANSCRTCVVGVSPRGLRRAPAPSQTRVGAHLLPSAVALTPRRILAVQNSAAEPEAARESGRNGALNVLVTGSTKGVGLALAREFLKSGANVVITSRDEDRVAQRVAELQSEFGASKVVGTPCDVADAASVEALAAFAKDHFGTIHVWINNAGTNAYFYGPLTECEHSTLREIVSTNLLGLMLCCRQAVLLMRSQPTVGHIFNMDGAGADGSATPRFAAYGATKRSLQQFSKSLQAELRMLDVPNVVVHNLSPGMVTTDLLMAGANTPQAKFFINALAEPPEEVAQFLVPRICDVVSAPSPSPSYIRFLTKPKAFSQIFQRLLFKARKDRYVPE